MDVLRSVDTMLKAASDYGPWVHAVNFPGLTTVTAATINCGGTTGRRYGSITAPTPATGLAGMYLVQCRMGHLNGSAPGVALLACLEYDLGTLTVSGNVFADGVIMPTKTVRGASIQTSSLLPMVYIATTLVATTPTLTITYKNQLGTGSRTATLILPTNAASPSVFQIAPRLQSGDTGIQDITGLSIDTGTGGSIKVMGVLPLAVGANVSFVQGQNSIDPLAAPWPIWLVEASEAIALYKFGHTTAGQGVILNMVGIAQPA